MIGYPIIRRDPEVLGGEPCLAGTRWATKIAYELDYDGPAIHAAFPHLTPEQVAAAIRFERSPMRRAGRLLWRCRERLAARLLGTDVETLRNGIW